MIKVLSAASNATNRAKKCNTTPLGTFWITMSVSYLRIGSKRLTTKEI